MTAVDAIARAGKGWSIEVTPPGADKIESFSGVLAEGTTVNVTFLPGTNPMDTVLVAERLRGEGMNPVPHIAARSIESKAQLKSIVDKLVEAAQVREVLVIAGGVDKPVGDFASSMEILETGIIQEAGITRIGVSGHPEGSPDIDADALAHALEWKNDFAAKNSGLEFYIETQFCFEAAPVIAWEQAIRKAGNLLPIRIGVPGPATIKTLLRFAQVSGIGPSMRMVAKQARNVTRLLTVQSPHLLVAGLADAINDKESRLAHLHYYPFGGFARTVRWANAVAAGEITMNPKGGFSVNEETE